MSTSPGALIDIPGLPNLRDVGGWPMASGETVAYGRLYRSIDLHRLAAGGAERLAALGIRTVYDLRTGGERDAEPDRLLDGARLVIADVLADAAGAAPAQLLALLHDPRLAERRLSGGQAAALFAQGYRDIVSLPSALAAYRMMFADLMHPASRPALVHCTTGKDRTGWAAAALLMLLGVSERDVMADYLLTNDELLPALQPIFDRFADAGGTPSCSCRFWASGLSTSRRASSRCARGSARSRPTSPAVSGSRSPRRLRCERHSQIARPGEFALFRARSPGWGEVVAGGVLGRYARPLPGRDCRAWLLTSAIRRTSTTRTGA